MDWVKKIAWLEPFWLLAAGPVLLLPGRFIPAGLAASVPTLQPYALAVLALGWPLRWLAYGRPTQRTPITISLAILLLWLPVNYWAAADKTLALDALGYLLFGLALYFALINWPPAQKRPEVIAWFIIILGLGLALVAPFVSNLALSNLFRLPSLNALLARLAEMAPGNINENRMAGTLLLLLPLYVVISFNKQPRLWLRLLCGATALFILGLLILSQSRAGWAAAAISLSLLLVLRWPRLLYLTPLAILAAGLLISQIGLENLLVSQSAENPIGGFENRLELWSRGFYAMSDFPFTGLGLGNFQRVIPILYPLFLVAPDSIVEHVHNIFLQVGLDLGFPGLIAYLAVHGSVYVLLWQILRNPKRDLNWSLAAGVMAGLTGMFVQGLVDAPVWGAKPAFVPWLLVALAVKLRLAPTKVQE